ncbi:MAG: hypothetical protein ACYDDS_10285 [Candidatus Sulfotelmatobacter sp.]|jgi:hypothetical protein
MLRLALASVLLFSTGAASQTATQVDHPRPEVDQKADSPIATPSSELPEAPSSIGGSPTSADSAPAMSGTRFVAATAVEEQKRNGNPRVVDSKFILLNALSTLALVADLETTAHDLEGTRSAELNPLFGQHPSRARLYGVSVPLNVISFYVSYHYKKSQPSRSLWKVGPALSIAVHTAATINNLIVAR